MVKTQRWMLGTVAALGLVAGNNSAADGYYVGAEIASDHLSFGPDISFVNGRPSRSDSPFAKRRARRSVAPPAPYGTSILTARAG